MITQIYRMHSCRGAYDVSLELAGRRRRSFIPCLATTTDPSSSSSSAPVPASVPHEQRRRAPMSEETKRKIAARRTGRKHSEETKSKIAQSMQSLPPRSIVHRLRISQARQNQRHSLETRRKIAVAVSRTKQKLRRERLAARAARAAEAATADLRSAYFTSRPSSPIRDNNESYDDEYEYDDDDEDDSDVDEENEEEELVLLDPLELEQAVIEFTALRRQLTSWMDAYENKFGKKADLTEASETHPLVYGRFVRYVALRELVRRSSVVLGSSPVTWE